MLSHTDVFFHTAGTDNFNQVSLACGPNISPHWQQLAKHLDIHLSIVTSISISKSGQTTQCFDELLSVWLRQTGSSNQPPPTWRLLCDAIANIDKPLSKKMWADHIKECSVCRKGMVNFYCYMHAYSFKLYNCVLMPDNFAGFYRP